MNGLFRKRVTEFLNEYLKIEGEFWHDEHGVSENCIKLGLNTLVKEDVLTPEEITQELLEYDVVLPPYQIEQWLTTDNAQ